ncbi:peptide chain release factor N(5)-glutamine methyltransferase [Aquibacillus halophilus]|uniref:Release factor glutamine methyltransferase n=1 Tax=Aquibacillus halophilus TaxID=930132 RepID=A0A6A8DJQ5_9BACI|nr:peptide chain release factor N(5)-glutamine methyltransferase [Aquibacillus halophilus]MRH43979.1 peptide chain release factor N(5)-glutamine methyltransferase [Aquibacillus halophilus]
MTEKQMYVHEALRWASLFLEKQNRETRIAEMILMHHLGINKSQLLASLRDQVPVDRLQAFQKDIHTHAETGVPVQHLIGSETFYGREFLVNQDVLIPRPETEELLVGVLDFIKKNNFSEPTQLVDIGTGSGIIAITLKLEQPNVQIWASDLSTKALTVAKKNAERLNAKVNFEQGDFLQPFIESGASFDVIVSNPPYIPFHDRDSLSDTVKNYDPELALFAEQDGLAAYMKIIEQAKYVMKKQALIAFEIGYQQGTQVANIIEHHFPQSKTEIRKDINGRDRMVFAEITNK